MLKIHIPKDEGIYGIAARTFADLWFQVTGVKPDIVTEAPSDGDLVVIGSDAANHFVHEKIIDGTIHDFALRTGSDDYAIKSAYENGRHLLFIAGGRGRALLYAVYDFFERSAGCHYFWDGDVIPSLPDIDIANIDVAESPRFDYRGLRYFAHRSLDRFQAEHWNLEQWQKEIDWILKKRMNFFMLRIGLDDLFQKAFPDIVDYPKWDVPEAVPRSYDDRNLFWSLQTRGELRKQLLQYARDRDLLHPEDLGTMTHWYSRTPVQYLDKVKPDFVPQSTSGYSEKTGLVWDIRQDKNLDAYFKLTETHIREYGAPELFHTIGLAERRCYTDDAANHEMKLYTYRRIINKLREKYPQAPLLIASWDFCMHWRPEQVRELVVQFDPSNTIILDYTSDTDDELNNFKNWGLLGKFPWIFGIFNAYEAHSEMRGNYNVIERNLPMAVEDPMCKGLIYWPEISHSDTLMIEYFAANTWSPTASNIKINDFVKTFCQNRYDEATAETMLPIWQAALPLAKSDHWSGPNSTYGHDYELYAMRIPQWAAWTRRHLVQMEMFANGVRQPLANCQPLLQMLADVNLEDATPFVKRDVIDIARMVAGRAAEYACASFKLAAEDWRNSIAPKEKPLAILAKEREILVVMLDILSASDEFSLYASLQALQEKHETNPKFEVTLKGNAENNYCRTQITELVSDIYIPVIDAFTDYFAKRFDSDNHAPFNDLQQPLKELAQPIVDAFYEKPLADMQFNTETAFEKLPQTISKMATIIAELTSL